MRRSSAFQRGSREGDRLVDGNLHLPDGDLPEALSAPAMDSPRLQGGEDEQERGSAEGKEWVTGEASGEGLGLYTESMAQGVRCTRRTGLDGEGGVSGRRCALSLGV
jgi:hypothetical protein